MSRGSTTNARIQVTADTRRARKSLNNFRNYNQRATGGIVGNWGQVTAGIAGVGLATQALTRITGDYNAVTRNLVSGTGRTGDALARIRSEVTAVAREVPLGLDVISTNVAALDTAFPTLLRDSPASVQGYRGCGERHRQRLR